MLQVMEETLTRLSKNWWLFVLRGVIAIIFGILVVAWPIASIFTLVIFFGAYVFVEGIFLIITGITHKGGWGNRAWLIFAGITGIAAGIVALVWPDITAYALLLVISVWAFVAGIAQFTFSFVAHTSIGNRILLALGGIFSIIFGIFLVARPGLGALAVVWLIGLFAVILGIYNISVGINLYQLKKVAPVK